MSENKDLVKSINLFGGSGTLKEMNLALLENQEVELKNGKKVTCSKMAKKEFRNPMFVIEVNGKDFKFDMFPAAEKMVDSKTGEIKDNPKFKELHTMLTNYVPMTQATPEKPATRVKFTGSLRDNVYVKDNEAHESWQLGLFNLSSSDADAEDSIAGELTGIIQAFTPEIRTVDEKDVETGRYKMDFYYLDYQLNACPVTIMLEPEHLDDIQELWQEGDSCHIYYQPQVITIGGAKQSTRGGFGKRESVSTGFSITELVINGGDEKFLKEEDLFISIEDIEKALEAREIMKEQKVKDAKEREKNKDKSGSGAGKSSAEKRTPKSFGTKTTFKSAGNAEDEECPFM